MTLKKWTISDKTGNQAIILNYGARLIQWQTQASQQNNIIVGCGSDEEYLKDGACMGAIAGPYANRIANSRFKANNRSHELTPNESSHLLHGGIDGLDKVYWQLQEQTSDCITLLHQYRPEPGRQTYPGNIDFLITYSVQENNGLLINLEAKSEQTVPIGPTGHAYFNLGNHEHTIDQHWLQLRANHYTPVDSEKIPTGEIKPVHGDFDFTERKPLDVSLDHNFAVDDTSQKLPVAALSNPEQTLVLKVFSDYPGVQIYTADHMGRKAACVEPQFYPNSPNEPAFPFEFTSPDNPFSRFIRYQMIAVET